MNEVVQLSNIEQWSIDKRIADARHDAELSEGETTLQVIQGGLSDNWQETYAAVEAEKRIVEPFTGPATINDPGPTEGT
jgi:hypothetical protein